VFEEQGLMRWARDAILRRLGFFLGRGKSGGADAERTDARG
jgi:hypothetical protein